MKIVLIGFDMQPVNGHHNWHSYYPDNDVRSHTDDYDRFVGPFDLIARGLDDAGVECVNATPGSALRAIPIMTPEEALGC
jgi:hypothetical protein